MNGLAIRLKLLRGNDSREVFAKKIGISSRSLVNYESGLREPKASILNQICARLGIESNWLLSGKEPMRVDERTVAITPVCYRRENDRHVGRFKDVPSPQLPENIDSDLNKTTDMSAVTPVCSRKENLHHGAGFEEDEAAQPVEIINEELNKTCTTVQVLKLQQEIIDLLREKNALTEQNASLRLEVRDREQRIRELEREIELLRREIALARSRAAGEETG